MRRPSEDDRTAPPDRVPALDGLRGAAVVAVLLFHAGHLAGGYLGVDLFFALSGFLITGLLLSEWSGTGHVRLSKFWARRARRLLPALFLMLVGVGVFAAAVAAPTELGRIRADSWATLGYIANWHAIFAGHDYWSLFAAPSPLDHTWSLAIEEQFYLVWPLIVVGLGVLGSRTRLPARVLSVALVGAAGLAALGIVLAVTGSGDARVYFGTDTRAPAILLGAALAAWSAWRGPARSTAARAALEACGLVGIGWLAWAWTHLEGQDPFLTRGGLLVCGVAAVAVLAAAAHPHSGPIAALFSVAPLRWLGLISYGLYLWHWPVYVWLDPARTGVDGWDLTGLRVGVSLALALSSYFLVEQPIRHGALKGWRIRVLTPAAAVVTVVIVVATTAGGISRPTTAETLAAGRHLVSSTPPPPSVPRILVVGDSVGYSFGSRMAEVDHSLGVASFNAGVVACQIPRSDYHRKPAGTDGPADDVVQTLQKCRDWPTRWRDQLAQVQPNDVVLTLGFPAVEDDEVNGVWHTACSPWWRRWYRSELTEAIRLLGSTGAHVWVTTIVRPSRYYFPKSLPWMSECYNQVLLQATWLAHASVIDTDRYVCPRRECHDYLDGQELRPDGIHFDGPGGRVLATWVVHRIMASPPQ